MPPPPAAPPVVINNIIAAPQPMMVTGGCNHILHLLLTMFTCGIWLPIWIICAIVQQPKVYGSAQQPTRRTNPLPVVGVIGGVILLAVTVTYPMTGFWIIFVGLLLAGAGYLGYMAYQREVKRRAERSGVPARAGSVGVAGERLLDQGGCRPRSLQAQTETEPSLK